MSVNRVKQLYESGQIAFGTYVTLPTAAVVEVAALAGFDFVRLDAYHVPFNPDTLADMVRTAYAHNITPWVRCQNDPWVIMTTLDTGAQAITIPNVSTPEAARAAVAAAFYPPKGERESSRPLRFRGLSAGAYFEWAASQVILSVQIEGREGIENYKDIVRVDGIDCIQTGRNDLSLALGLPGQDFHPQVLEAEARIVTAALEAGKQVSLLYPMTDDGLERTLRWMEQGVRIMTIDSDYAVLLGQYRAWMNKLRGPASD